MTLSREWQTQSNEFVSIINKAINSHTTVKEIKLSPKNVKREKWMTQGLLKSAQSVQKLFKKQIGVSKESPKHTKYVEHRNLYNYLKRKAKQQYYSEVFEKHKSDVRKTWRELNRLIAKSNDKTTIIKSININGEMVTDPQKQANSFAQYFGDIGHSYNKKIPKSKKSFEEYLSNKNKSNIFITTTDTNEVMILIDSLKNKPICVLIIFHQKY